MNWEETIIQIRKNPEYHDLVEMAYFDENLMLNVDRFKNSIEFKETLKLIQQYAPNSKKILDIGCGNGISTISFALNNYQVTAVEPDPSNTIGAGAIRELIKLNHLQNVNVFEDYAENIKFDSNSFDVVYVRQAMHHAYDLKRFILECSRVLKPGGLLLTIRDHVIFNDKDKAWFLEMHPLQKFYGGENAFLPEEYKNAMKIAGLKVVKEIKYYESPINFSPNSQAMIDEKFKELTNKRYINLKNKIGPLADINFVKFLYAKYLDLKNVSVLDETMVPGRMYSYVCIKK